MRPFGVAETLVTVFGPGQFTGEVNRISCRRTFFRVRASTPGKVIELDRQHMLALMQTDAELGLMKLTAEEKELRQEELHENDQNMDTAISF
jgi:hypothetical protein